MAVYLESQPRKTINSVSAPDGSNQDDKRGTRVETRIHQRQCAKCKRWFWAWDPVRLCCFLCDAPPPGEVKRILDAIHTTTG
jgi:hypothetical protein